MERLLHQLAKREARHVGKGAQRLDGEKRRAGHARSPFNGRAARASGSDQPLEWLELWAIARYDLGITSYDEFGRLTLAQFEALLDRKMEEHRRSMLCAGVVASTVANSAPFGDPKRKAISPMDFVPEYKRRAPEEPQSIEEQIAIMKSIAESANRKTN